jgi:hypothetical protein
VEWRDPVRVPQRPGHPCVPGLSRADRRPTPPAPRRSWRPSRGTSPTA